MAEKELTFIEKVNLIQTKLKAPKGQFNAFGKYKYRNCEDILEATKSLLSETGLVLTINDEIINIGDRYYIKATATLTDGENKLENSALAREAQAKKGMDESQLTGATSSYARKYALNGLLAIDDNEDADSDIPDVANTNTSQMRMAKNNNFVMPFGKNKGKNFSDLQESDLENAKQWCIQHNDKGQFNDLIGNIDSYLGVSA